MTRSDSITDSVDVNLSTLRDRGQRGGRAAVHGADRAAEQKQQHSARDAPKQRAREHVTQAAPVAAKPGSRRLAPTSALQGGPGATGLEGREVEVQPQEISTLLWRALPRMRGSLNH